MTHPIIPSCELVQDWSDQALTESGVFEVKKKFATLSAQWGADEELDACCELLGGQSEWDQLSQCTEWKEFRDLSEKILRAARRPKPMSLKEQAFQALARVSAKSFAYISSKEMLDDFGIIRCALLDLHD